MNISTATNVCDYISIERSVKTNRQTSTAATVRDRTLSLFKLEDRSSWWEDIFPFHSRPNIQAATFVQSNVSSLVEGLEEELPLTLSHLAEALNQSRWMLDLSDDWDDEGSPGYAEATWERAARFLIDSVKYLHNLGLSIAVPKVQNGPEGTIDLFWETDNTKLLLNIPVELDGAAQYYGYKSDGSEVRGSLNTAFIKPWLVLWAAEQPSK